MFARHYEIYVSKIVAISVCNIKASIGSYNIIPLGIRSQSCSFWFGCIRAKSEKKQLGLRIPKGITYNTKRYNTKYKRQNNNFLNYRNLVYDDTPVGRRFVGFGRTPPWSRKKLKYCVKLLKKVVKHYQSQNNFGKTNPPWRFWTPLKNSWLRVWWWCQLL